ncbi:hypothetical protein RKE29_11070 [Streptomyces sp. B1866]|uniref:hypothetical protein n=1 Tax=Streptomyces sp. B1866 TaxID=3075431 RepID=UPI00288D43CB|nr:hypothetical protein [Streptomyces sp. B1866]MDT3397180.1 hypothetical protein [Streptomyces sp. B1866]
MLNKVVRMLGSLRQVFAHRQHGRHRAVSQGARALSHPRANSVPETAVIAKDPPTLRLPRVPAEPVSDPADEVFWPVDVPLVRPFVLAYERKLAERERELTARRRASRAERRVRRRRRWAASLAAYGIDVGPRRIHGVEVARAGAVPGGGWAWR